MKKRLLIPLISLLYSTLFISSAAADTAITTIEIKRNYTTQVNEIPDDALKLVLKTRHVSMEAKPLFSEPEIGDSLDYLLTFTADEDYNFRGLKIGSCQSSFGTFSDLSISDDRKTATVSFTADPPTVQLQQPENLVWEGTTASWDPVPNAEAYEVELHYISNNGQESNLSLETLSVTETSYDFKKQVMSQPRDYIFSVKAIPEKGTCLANSKRTILDLENSLLIGENEIGIFGGVWLKKKEKWYYKNNGQFLSNGTYVINGEKYLFSETGEMLTGWQFIDNAYYYFSQTTGEMLTGTNEIDGKKYLFSETGEMLTGFQNIDNRWYYMTETGEMLTGWQNINTRTYYFHPDGHMNQEKHLITFSGILCVFRDDGSLAGQIKLNTNQ